MSGSAEGDDDREADRLGEWADECADGANGADPLAGSGRGAGEEGGAGGRTPDDGPHDGMPNDATRAAARALLGAGLSEAAIDEALDRARDPRPHAPVPVPPGYELLEEIGRGGGGVVYRARQVGLDREVAIKVLHAGDGLFDAAIRRFEREARALARVRHPGIVAVHEVGSTGGRLWYAMDLVEGTSLADELAAGPYEPRAAAALVRAVADAVAAVHEHGLVHRDLKPGNVLLDRAGKPYVGDFGLALELGASDDLTLTGQVIGTPAYMAPEQARGDAASVGPATDVYALGAILYEAVGGRRPFAGLSPPEQVYAAIHRDPASLRHVRRSVPEELVRVVEQAMRKRPGDRYPTARALVEDLDRFLANAPVLASAGRARRLAGLVRRRGALLGWATALVLAATAVLPRLLTSDRATAASVLVEAADEAAKEGDAESAWRLYARAVAASPTPLPIAVRLPAAETEIPRARRLIEAGRAKEVLERADERLVTLDGRDRDAVERGPIMWTRGMALAALERRPEALAAFHASADTWRQNRYSVATERDGAWQANTWDERDRLVVERKEDAVRALASPSPSARRVAWLETRVPIGFGAALDGDLSRVVRAANDTPAMLRNAMEEEMSLKHNEVSGMGGTAWWARAFVAHAMPSLYDALADLAADTSASTSLRGAAATLLAAAADLPTVFGVEIEIGGGAERVDPMPTVALWQSVRAASPAEGLRRRVDAALAGAPSPEEAHARASWCATHLPFPTTDFEKARLWWAAHRADDLVPGLATSLGLPVDRPVDPRAVLDGAHGSLSTRAHVLLTLVAPPGADLPRLSCEGPSNDAIGRWRAIFLPDGGPWSLRVGRLEFDLGRGWVLDEADRFVDLEIDRLVTLTDERPIDGMTPTVVSFRMPMTVRRDDGARVRLEVDAVLRRGSQGLEIDCPRIAEARFGPGGSATRSGGSGGHAMPIDFVFCPTRGHGYGYPNPTRHIAFLVAVEPRSAPRTSWTLAEWRGRIARDLGRIVQKADEIRAQGPRTFGRPDPYDEDWQALRHLTMLAGAISVPEAVGPIRRLLVDARDTLPHDDFVANLRRALWLAKVPDAPALDVPPKPESTGMDLRGMEEACAWVRAIVDDPTPALRAVAEARLRALPLGSELAGDLLDAQRLGRITLSPALSEHVAASAPEDRSYPGRVRSLRGWAVFAGVLDLLSLLALVFAFRPGRRPGAGLEARAWLVFLGVAAACIDVVALGVDLLPDACGFALAAVGSAALARPLRGRGRWTSPVAFALGAVVTALRGAVPSDVEVWALPIAAAVGIAWAPRLAFRLRGSAETAQGSPPVDGGGRWTSRLVVLTAIAGTIAVLEAVGSTFVLVATLLATLWVLWRLWTASPGPRRPWPLAFVGLYVLPTAALLGAAFVTAVGGFEPWTVRGDVASAVLAAVWLSTLWALLSLVMAARVRAAWQRVRASGGT